MNDTERQTNQTNRKKYFSVLDGWRGYAILWIVFGHINSIYGYDITKGLGRLVFQFSSITRLAVDIFLVLSGFLLVDKLLDRPGLRSTLQFYKHRAWRILPQYFMLVLFVISFNFLVPEIPYNYRITQIAQMDARVYTLVRIIDKGSLYHLQDENRNIIEMRVERKRDEVVVELRGPVSRKVLREDLSFLTQLDNVFSTGTVTFKSRPITNKLKFSSRTPDEKVLPFFLFLQNYTPIENRVNLLNHTWFVAMIVQFYLLYGIVMYFIGRLFREPESRKRALLALILPSILVFNFLRLKYGGQHTNFFHMFHFRFDVILIGCLLRLWQNHFEAIHRRIGSPAPYAFFITGIAAILAIFLNAPYNYQEVPILFTLSYLGFGLMIIASLMGFPASRALFSNRVIRRVGRHSYGIYLWHFPLMYMTAYLRNFVQMNTALSIAIDTVLIVLVSSFLDALLSGMVRRIRSFGRQSPPAS